MGMRSQGWLEGYYCCKSSILIWNIERGHRIRWPTIFLDWRIKLCRNWVKRLKSWCIPRWTFIGRFPGFYPMVRRLCELSSKWLGYIGLDFPLEEDIHAWCEKVLFKWALLMPELCRWNYSSLCTEGWDVGCFECMSHLACGWEP